MPITFKTKSYADITMLNETAEAMLRMMDFGDVIPGAIAAKDVGKALSNLQQCLAVESSEKDLEVSDDAEDEPMITLSTRALPLLALLQAASANGDNVSWT